MKIECEENKSNRIESNRIESKNRVVNYKTVWIETKNGLYDDMDTVTTTVFVPFLYLFLYKYIYKILTL